MTFEYILSIFIAGILGGIIDDSFRVGKEERVAMKMAVEDFNEATNHTLILHTIRSSITDPMKAALSGKVLVLYLLGL